MMNKMTKKEALKKVRGYLTDYLPLEDANEIDEIIEALKSSSSDDCINKSEVLNLLKGIEILHNHDELRTNLIYGIMSLSPVTPQPKVGKWIYIGNSEVNGLKICKCSNCEKKTYGSHKFCPNCGAKMEVEE